MQPKEKKSVPGIISEHARTYCETTTVHGFAYWTSAPRLPEKAFWVALVIAFMTCAGLIIGTAVKDWIEDPVATTIKTFSKVHFSKSFKLQY